MVRNELFQNHKILAEYRLIDGIIGLKLLNTETDATIGIVSNYLSPDSFRYGKDPEGYFNELTSLWTDLSDCDFLIGGGDLNSRTKKSADFISDIDGNLPPRSNPDQVENNHGKHFLQFLKDNRSVICNGRITPEFSDYTFLSSQGNSVPVCLYNIHANRLPPIL